MIKMSVNDRNERKQNQQVQMKKMVPRRLVIYAKDVENITGKSPQFARRLLQRMRKKLGKKSDGFITITEFCEHTGLPEDQVIAVLN
jgi:hypothetical protein